MIGLRERIQAGCFSVSRLPRNWRPSGLKQSLNLPITI